MKKLTILLVATTLALAPAAFAANNTQSQTNTLSVAVAAEADLTITSASTTTLSSNSSVAFSPYAGTTTFSYHIRTSQSGGTGSLTVQVTSDFSPSGGPSAASVTDPLTITCGAVTTNASSACSGSPAVNTSGTTQVINFGANARSAKTGDSSSVSWSLVNDPQYPTNTYTATATFTISAA